MGASFIRNHITEQTKKIKHSLNTNESEFPFFAKISLYILGLFAFVAILYIAKAIIIPLVFAILIATVLHPVVGLFTRLKLNRVVAIVITLFLSLLIFGMLGTLLFSQALRFSESWPLLIDKLADIFHQSATWVSEYFDIKPQRIDEWIATTKNDFIEKNSSEIGHTLASAGSKIMLVFIMPVYVFMILYYQPLLLEFIRLVFGKSNRSEVSEVISEIKKLIQSYLLGLLLEVAIIATLYTLGLYILGIEYALILGIIGALLNLIPYLGAILAAALPMMVALISKTSPWFALLVLALYVFIQLIDNNFIVPKFVASKVKINALITLIVVLAFGLLWGIGGMFLAIPLTAVAKLVFDHIDSLKPYGYLLGDTLPPQHVGKPKE